MKKIDIGQTAGILANIGVIAGIAILVFEVRQNTLATSLNVAQNYSDNLSAINYFVANDNEIAQLIAEIEADPASFDTFDRSSQIRLLNFWAAQIREWESAYNLFVTSNLGIDLLPSLRGQIAFILSISPDSEVSQSVFTTWRDMSSTFSESFNLFFEEIATESGFL